MPFILSYPNWVQIRKRVGFLLRPSVVEQERREREMLLRIY